MPVSFRMPIGAVRSGPPPVGSVVSFRARRTLKGTTGYRRRVSDIEF